MKRKAIKPSLILLLLCCLHIIFALPIDATQQGTHGDELPVMKAEKLEIELGTKWVGVEFQLKTDAGMYPGVIVVGEDGVLRLEIGGSSRYVLSCFHSSVPIPTPEDTSEMISNLVIFDSEDETIETNQDSETEQGASSTVSLTMHHMFFVGGVALILGFVIGIYDRGKKQKVGGRYDHNDEH